MSTFAVNLNSDVYIPVVADDFQFTIEKQRVSATQPVPPRIQCLTFINYNGVDLTRFLGDAMASAPSPQVVEDDYWIPAKNVYTVHKVVTGAAAPAVPPTATKNVFLVVPIGMKYSLPLDLAGGEKLDPFPLFIADSFYFTARSKQNDHRNKAQVPMGGAEVVLVFTNYRGRARWIQLSAPGSLPPIYTAGTPPAPALDYYLPIKYVAAVFRIRSQVWI